MSEPVAPCTVDEHLASLTSERVVKRIIERTGGDPQRIVATLNTYAAECRYGSRLIAMRLPASGRILEVGAGLGMLSSYLRKLGHDIVALEPCTSGFDFFTGIQAVLLEEAGTDMPVLRVGAEELSPSNHDYFHFIFSINVLEHIPDATGAMRGMTSVLASGGRMWHTCPNYAFPYEPHFGLPLIPLFPRATTLLLPHRVSESQLWQSLNFITYFRLKQLARANGLSTTFRAGTMAEALSRLDSDYEFATRQSGLASQIYRMLKAIGGLSLIEALPAAVSTPMMVAMEKRHVVT
jgi:SAM-dependent methyltransferase